MNNNLTEMIFILDMSGSMVTLRDETIDGYNTMIEEQLKAEGDANVTTVLFDDRYILLHDRVPIQDVAPLTRETYTPDGLTALYDAVGKTVVDVGHKLYLTPEEERPGKVVVTIITDGYENASKEYQADELKFLITQQKDVYSWIFTFIGTDIDAMKVGTSIGVDPKLSKNFTRSKAGLESVFKGTSNVMYTLRSMDFATMDSYSIIDAAEKELNSVIINN